MRTARATNQIDALAEQSEPYKNFISSLDSEVTKNGYRYSLRYFMRFLKIDNYNDLLKIEPAKLEGIIRDFIVNMRQDRKLSPSTVSVRIAAIAHFFEMNDVDLRWKKLKKFKGKFRNIIEDKPYTREQIKNLTEDHDDDLDHKDYLENHSLYYLPSVCLIDDVFLHTLPANSYLQ